MSLENVIVTNVYGNVGERIFKLHQKSFITSGQHLKKSCKFLAKECSCQTQNEFEITTSLNSKSAFMWINSTLSQLSNSKMWQFAICVRLRRSSCFENFAIFKRSCNHETSQNILASSLIH
jgi:hypothetical protein